MAFKEAVRKASPVLLEPVMSVEVVVAEEYMGAVIGDLNSRRGRFEGIEHRAGSQVIKSMVPLAEMLAYAVDLHFVAQGCATFSCTFHGMKRLHIVVSLEAKKQELPPTSLKARSRGVVSQLPSWTQSSSDCELAIDSCRKIANALSIPKQNFHGTFSRYGGSLTVSGYAACTMWGAAQEAAPNETQDSSPPQAALIVAFAPRT